MAGNRVNRVVLAGALIGGAAGVLLATPRGRRWLESIRHWVEYSVEDLGQLLESRVERSSMLHRPRPGASTGASREVDEQVITTRVREALARDPRVHARRVEIMMIGGVLHLEGAVSSLEEREIAGELAQEAARTHILVNDLHIAAP